jgi:hypothetical protein
LADIWLTNGVSARKRNVGILSAVSTSSIEKPDLLVVCRLFVAWAHPILIVSNALIRPDGVLMTRYGIQVSMATDDRLYSVFFSRLPYAHGRGRQWTRPHCATPSYRWLCQWP